MRRPAIALLLTAVVLGTLIGGRVVAAQDPEVAEHPAKGSWTIASDPGDTEFSPRLMILSADGGAIFVSG